MTCCTYDYHHPPHPSHFAASSTIIGILKLNSVASWPQGRKKEVRPASALESGWVSSANHNPEKTSMHDNRSRGTWYGPTSCPSEASVACHLQGSFAHRGLVFRVSRCLVELPVDMQCPRVSERSINSFGAPSHCFPPVRFTSALPLFWHTVPGLLSTSVQPRGVQLLPSQRRVAHHDGL